MSFGGLELRMVKENNWGKLQLLSAEKKIPENIWLASMM